MRDPEGIGLTLNRLAREQMKLRILSDVSLDLVVCELEGIDPTEYIRELEALLDDLGECIAVLGRGATCQEATE